VLVSVMAAGVMLAQCTAARPHLVAGPSPSATASSTASAPPAPSGRTVQPVTPAELGASWRPGCQSNPRSYDESTSTISVSTARPTAAS